MKTFKDYFDVISAIHEVKTEWVRGDPSRDAQITMNTAQELIEINLNLRPDDTAEDVVEVLGPLEQPPFHERFTRKPYDVNNPNTKPEGNLRIYLVTGSNIWVQVAIEWDLMKTPINQ